MPRYVTSIPEEVFLSCAKASCSARIPPSLTEEATSAFMDGIFASNDVDMQGSLLKIIQDFLSTTSAKQTELEKGSGDQYHAIEALLVKPPTVTVNMDEFIGNVQGFAKSGCLYLR